MTEHELIVGTYEEFLLGYKAKKEGEHRSVQSFATHAHTGSVRCVAAGGRYLVSGGTDDKIIVHDLVNRTENRALMHHNGTVNAVALTENGTHVLSGSSDGSIYITKTGNWQIEKIWHKAHKGSPVTGIAIHPSNKLALTIGDDNTLRTWNLVKGRQAYAINLASKGILRSLTIEWEPNGEYFSLTGNNTVSVWNVSDGAIKKTIGCPSKSICMVWASSDVAVIGLENGSIMLFNIATDKNEIQEGHTQRVRDIKYLNNQIYSASSSGHIKIWDLDVKELSLVEKCTINTGCRITCIILAQISTAQIKKEELSDEEETRAKVTGENILSTSFTPYVSVEVEDESLPKKKNFRNKIRNKKFDHKIKNKQISKFKNKKNVNKTKTDKKIIKKPKKNTS